MRHEISGFEALRFGGASLGGKTLADGQSHAVVAEAFLSETLEINRMASRSFDKGRATPSVPCQETIE